MSPRKGNLMAVRDDIKVIDATIRDGGLCNNFAFSDEFVKELYKTNIKSGIFDPFAGELYSQTGVIQKESWKSLLPEEVVKMEWLAENVIGDIPKRQELKKRSEPVVLQQGVEKTKG